MSPKWPEAKKVERSSSKLAVCCQGCQVLVTEKCKILDVAIKIFIDLKMANYFLNSQKCQSQLLKKGQIFVEKANLATLVATTFSGST